MGTAATTDGRRAAGHRPRPRGGMRLLAALAGCAAVGIAVAATAAAFVDGAEAPLEPVGGTYDLAFVATDGTTQQGRPDPFLLDGGALGRVGAVGADDVAQLELSVLNAGTTDAGEVSLSATTLLPTPPADADGVVRDPFDILLVSIAVDGAPASPFVPADELDAPLGDWPAGQVRAVTVRVAHQPDLGTPFYQGKDLSIGLVVTGEA